MELEIDTAPDSGLLFEVDPGPAGNWAHDWAAVDRSPSDRSSERPAVDQVGG